MADQHTLLPIEFATCIVFLCGLCLGLLLRLALIGKLNVLHCFFDAIR